MLQCPWSKETETEIASANSDVNYHPGMGFLYLEPERYWKNYFLFNTYENGNILVWNKSVYITGFSWPYKYEINYYIFPTVVLIIKLLINYN